MAIPQRMEQAESTSVPKTFENSSHVQDNLAMAQCRFC